MLQEINCRIVKAILDYVDTLDIDTTLITRGIPFSEEYLRTPLNWVPAKTCASIINKTGQMLKDDSVMFNIGLTTPLLDYFSEFQRLLLLTDTPHKAYKYLPVLLNNLSNIHKLEINTLSANSVSVKLYTLVSTSECKGLCFLLQGVLASIPTLWKLPHAVIRERKCIYAGYAQDSDRGIQFNSEYCEFEIYWQKIDSSKALLDKISQDKKIAFPAEIREVEDAVLRMDQANNELVRRNYELDIIRQLSVTIGSLNTEQEVFSAVSEYARDIPGIRFVAVEKLDENCEYFETHYYSKIRDNRIKEQLKELGLDITDINLTKKDSREKLRFRVDRIVDPSNLKNPEIVTIDDLYQLMKNIWDEKLCKKIQDLLNIQKLVVVPINPEGRLIGTMLFFLDEEINIDILEMIGAHCCIALKNVNLNNKLRRRINELEATRSRLIEAQEKMRLTLKSMADGILVTDKRGRVISTNEASARMYGCEKKTDLHGKNGLLYVEHKDWRRFMELIKNAYSGEIIKNVEFSYIKQNGILFPAETTISLYINAAGEFDGYVICLHDISGKRYAEKLVQESEKRYRLIAENSQDLISIIDTAGNFKYLSPSYRMLGHIPEELIGRSCLECVHPDDCAVLIENLSRLNEYDTATLKKLAEHNYSEQLEYRCIDAWGTPHVLETRASVIESLDSETPDILLMCRDITTRRKAQEELQRIYNEEQKLRNSLEQEIARRAEFFRALVHELKTPLTPIIASTEAIKDMASDNAVKQLANNAFQGAVRLDTRVNELLDISRGELGMLKLKRTPFPIESLLKEIVDYMLPQARSSRQKLVYEFDDNLPVIFADEVKLRQVIINLLNNAMKFTPKDGAVTMKAGIVDNNLLIKIHDDGRGISEEEQKRLFQPYSRIEADRQNFSGLGLGLALCKQFVELHDGRIWIDSAQGQGSTFSFTLPLDKNGYDGTMGK